MKFAEIFSGYLPPDAKCWKCIKAADAAEASGQEFQISDQQAVTCDGIDDVPLTPPKLEQLLPCARDQYPEVERKPVNPVEIERRITEQDLGWPYHGTLNR
jgi:hypothetical protein